MRYAEWGLLLIISGLGIALANFVGFEVGFMDSLPGILILLAISAVAVVIDLKNRIELINSNEPAVTVSIHQNSYPDETVKGSQIFYFTHSAEGKEAAERMQEEFLAAFPDNTRELKANDTYYLLKKTEVPTIIVECGFLSNSEETKLLSQDEYQLKLAKTIAKGIESWAVTAG